MYFAQKAVSLLTGLTKHRTGLHRTVRVRFRFMVRYRMCVMVRFRIRVRVKEKYTAPMQCFVGP